MIRLQMKKYNIILTEKKKIKTICEEVRKYYSIIKEE